MIDFSKLKVLTAAERQATKNNASPARLKRILNGAATGAAKA
jgi:hypothetical protein